MSAENNSKPRISIIRLLGTVVAFGLIVYLVARQWDDIRTAVVQIGWARFALALGVLLVSRFMVSLRWHMLLRSVDWDISPWDTIRLTFVGLFASNFLPTTIGGDVVRLAGAVQMGYDAAVAAASLVVDRLVGMFGMALVLPPGLQRLLASGAKFEVPILGSSLAGWPAKFADKVQGVLKRVWQAVLLWLKHPKGLLTSILFTGLHQSFLFLSIYILLEALNEPISFWLIAGLWSLVYFVTLLPVSINGLGVQELSITFAFSELGGVSEHTSLILALLVRTIFMLASLPGAFYIRAILPQVRQQEKAGE
jgi:glycosyltransferase 2 family protein